MHHFSLQSQVVMVVFWSDLSGVLWPFSSAWVFGGFSVMSEVKVWFELVKTSVQSHICVRGFREWSIIMRKVSKEEAKHLFLYPSPLAVISSCPLCSRSVSSDVSFPSDSCRGQRASFQCAPTCSTLGPLLVQGPSSISVARGMAKSSLVTGN